MSVREDMICKIERGERELDINEMINTIESHAHVKFTLQR